MSSVVATWTNSSTSSSSLNDTFSSTEGISAFFVLFSALLALVLILSNVLRTHAPPWLQAMFPEAGMILLVAMMASGMVELLSPGAVVTPDAYYSMNNEDAAAGDGDRFVGQALLSSFSPRVFFVALLPPIIFNSGYHVRRELLFRHMTPIVLLAVVGTLISCVVITVILYTILHFGGGLGGNNFHPTFTELLAFGALLSATDPVSTLAVFQEKRVDPQLFYLVFGEAVLNDAVGWLLFQTARKLLVVHRDGSLGDIMGGLVLEFLLNAVGSPCLGVVCGGGAALLFHYVELRATPLTELSVYVLIMYVPFLLAQLWGLSGIVTILFTGMMAYAYVRPNVSVGTAQQAETLFRLAAHLAETSIFLELGLSVFGLLRKRVLHGKLIGWTLLACLVARASHVYPICILYNQQLRRRRERRVGELPNGSEDGVMVGNPCVEENTVVDNDEQSRHLNISWPTAHMVCFSGLRGAVAYACSRTFPDTFGHANEFVVATMAIVLITVFLLGGSTSAMLALLKIDIDVDEAKYAMESSTSRPSPDRSLLLRLEDILQRNLVRPSSDVELVPQRVPQMTQHHDLSMRTSTSPQHQDHEEHHFESMDEEVHPQPNSLFDFGKS